MGEDLQKKSPEGHITQPRELHETVRILKDKLKKSEVIFKLIQDLTPNILPKDMLGHIVKAAKSIVNADTASIVFLDEEGGKLKIAVSESSGEKVDGSILQPSLDEKTSITGWVIKNKQPILLLPDTLKSDERFSNIKWKESIKCSINVPMIFKGLIKGTLNLNITRSDYMFNEEDLAIAVTLADYVALALENSGLYSTMKDSQIEKLKNVSEELETMSQRFIDVQNQLMQAEKMSAIGELTSGVTHDVNNLLSGVMGNTQIIMMELKSNGKVDDLDALLKIIEESAKRCKVITQNLLNFSRSKKESIAAFDMHKSLDSILMLTEYGFKSSQIKIKKKYAEGLPQGFAKQTEIQQVFLNILSNAKWAIEKKGEKERFLTIETRKLDDKFIEVNISDNGIGMSEETRNKIFNTFFTTKEVGEGTGLGLSVCREIMRRNKGDLSVESEPGKGATFHIKLPTNKEE